jgi:hypothetical protein
MILEHRLISESERVAIKTKLRSGDVGVRGGDSGKSTEPHVFAPGPQHHIKREPGL